MKILRALLFFLAFVATAAFANDVVLAPVTPAVDFGVVSPEANTQALTTVSFSIESSQSWSVSAVLDDTRDGIAPMAAAQPSNGIDLVVRGSGGSSSRLLTGLSTPVAQGTGAEGPRIVTLMLQARAGWDARPGRYARNLRITADGNPNGITIPVTLEIPELTMVVPDARPYTIEVADPSKPAELSSDPHLYQIRSNVPWVLTARLTADPKINGTDRALQKGSIFVVAGSDKRNPIAPANGAIVLVTGNATGEQPQSVELKVELSLATGDVAGTYSAPLTIEAHPLSAVPHL